MIGRRRRGNTKPWNLSAGDYMKRRSRWMVCLPSGVGPCRLDDRWNVTEHADRTITVAPSIHDNAGGWHGYLERGVWRSV